VQSSGHIADLDAVVGRMLGSPRVRGSGLVGVYWEVYELELRLEARGETMRVVRRIDLAS
jgi:hypothetical protein